MVVSCFLPSEGWGKGHVRKKAYTQKRLIGARCTSVLRRKRICWVRRLHPARRPRGTYGYRHTYSLYPKLVDLSRQFAPFCRLCLKNCNFIPLFSMYGLIFWQFANKYERKLNRKKRILSEKAFFRHTLFLKKGLLFRKVYGIISRYEQNIYPWHSWIARQTPTLKVEGSNPFG